MKKRISGVWLVTVLVAAVFVVPATSWGAPTAPDYRFPAISAAYSGEASVARKAGKKKRKKARARKTGKLEIRVGGLPKGSRAKVTVRGPRVGRKSKRRFFRKISRVGRVVIRRAPVGKYRVIMAPVKMSRTIGTIEKGAVAKPVRKVRTVRVTRGGGRRVNALYGTVVNPGVVTLKDAVLQAGGDPALPDSVFVTGSGAGLKGKIVSAPPSSILPRGLLAHVVEVTPGEAATQLSLTPASMYEAVPNMSLNVPLGFDQNLSRAAVSCDAGGSASISPYATVERVTLTGSWITTKVLFANVPTGADVKVRVGLAAGVRINAEAGASCSLDLPGLAIHGMAGPVPVYGKIAPGATASVESSASIDAGAKMDVVLGARVNTKPLEATPHFKTESPRFELDVRGPSAAISAGVTLGLELGIGVSDIGNIHLKLGNELKYTMDREGCRWDLFLGTFSAGGKIGPLPFSTSSTSGKHLPLSDDPGCGGFGGPVDPPRLRARVSWNSDADVDLHVWDEWGWHTNFRELNAIDDSFLVTDVIPSEGDFGNHAEEFYESGNFGRPYTIGVCLYSGDYADLQVEVFDPNGQRRVFTSGLDWDLYEELITVSPAGADVYDPYWDYWCDGP